MVTSSVILEIVEIIYFVPALPFAIWVCIKHGFNREAGWLLLAILSLVRIIGAATGIAAWKIPNDASLIATSLIMSSIGSATLVAALLGIANRIETGTGASSLPAKFRRYLQIIGLVAIIIGIVGGTKIASSDPDTRSGGRDYLKASIILVLVQLLATTVILGMSARKLRYIWAGDRTLFFVAAACVPFVFVRVIYSLCSAFNPTSKAFSLTSSSVLAVVLRAVLALAMEIIAVTLLIFGGLKAPKMRHGEASAETTGRNKQPPEGHQLGGTAYQPVPGRQQV